MTVVFTPQAREEYLAAISYYESARSGLGSRFEEEVKRVVSWISQHASLLREHPGGYKRANLRIFPYYLPFIVRGETLWVLAVAHGSRAPEYWIGRKTKGT